MNELNLTFSNFSVLISTVIRVITGIILLAFVIPLQWKQANVKNGLRSLRKALLVSGIILFIVMETGLIIILFKPFVSMKTNRLITDSIAIFNSVGFFIIAYIKYQIYHEQYTPKNIKLHEKIEKQEEKESK